MTGALDTIATQYVGARRSAAVYDIRMKELIAAAAFNVRGAAAYLSLGETQFRELLKSGEIRSRRAGRRHVIAKAELDRWLTEKAT